MSSRCFSLLLLPFLIGTAGAAENDAVREAQKAVVTVIHLAPDGSDILRGHGFLISADGLLVTNYHLVVQAARLQVQLANGDVYDQVTLRGLDPEGDVALLKIPAFNAPFIPLEPRAPAAPGDQLQVIPRNDPDAASSPAIGKVIAHHTPNGGLDLVVFASPLDARTKGCPVLDGQGSLAGITTLSYESGTGTGVLIGANRLLDLPNRPPKNWPLDMMDWTGWSTSEDPAAKEPLSRLGLRRKLPPPQLRTEKNLGRRLELALEFDPTDLQTKALLARAYIQERDYRHASTQIDQILAKTPESISILTLRADLLHHTGDFDEARRLYEEIVTKGQNPPHNYDKELQGVILTTAFHDHKLLNCSGPIILGVKLFTYRGDFQDRFSANYGNIEKVSVKHLQQSGQTVHEFAFAFSAPVSNESKSWQKKDFQLRLSDQEASDNLVSYLRKRGISVSD